MRPDDDQITTCRTCKARIFFARTDRGALMPLDEQPVSAELIAPVARWRYESSTTRVYLDKNPEGEAYFTHFATCPARQPTPPPNPIARERWELNKKR